MAHYELAKGLKTLSNTQSVSTKPERVPDEAKEGNPMQSIEDTPMRDGNQHDCYP